MTTIHDLEVRHGYTMGDLHTITKAAVSMDRLMASDVQDRYNTAWSAIAEHLCAAEQPLQRHELVRVGWQAIYREAGESRQLRGFRNGYGDGDPNMPRFHLYWGTGVTRSHEDGIVDKLATRQILATLANPIQRDAVVALAVHADYQKAADSLDITYKALTLRLGRARDHLIGLWFEHETPHRTRHTDRRVASHSAEPATHCQAGHEYTPENLRIDHRMHQGRPRRTRRCLACQRERRAGQQVAA